MRVMEVQQSALRGLVDFIDKHIVAIIYSATDYIHILQFKFSFGLACIIKIQLRSGERSPLGCNARYTKHQHMKLT